MREAGFDQSCMEGQVEMLILQMRFEIWKVENLEIFVCRKR